MLLKRRESVDKSLYDNDFYGDRIVYFVSKISFFGIKQSHFGIKQTPAQRQIRLRPVLPDFSGGGAVTFRQERFKRGQGFASPPEVPAGTLQGERRRKNEQQSITGRIV
jgi:hypothetical protein